MTDAIFILATFVIGALPFVVAAYVRGYDAGEARVRAQWDAHERRMLDDALHVLAKGPYVPKDGEK